MISVKLRKNYEDIFDELCKIFGNTSHKLLKEQFEEKCEIFTAIFRTYEKLQGTFYFREKLEMNLQEILEIFGKLLKIYSRPLKNSVWQRKKVFFRGLIAYQLESLTIRMDSSN